MKYPAFVRLLCLTACASLAAGCATKKITTGAAQPAGATAAAAPVTPAKPSAPLPPAPGAAVTLSETEKGKTVRVSAGATVAVRLNVDESTGNRWFMANRLEGGHLAKKGYTTYADTSGGRVATLLFQCLKPGKQELHFYYAPPEARQNAARMADFAVIVQ